MSDISLPVEFDATTARLVGFAMRSALTSSLLLDGGGLVEGASPAAVADLDVGPDDLMGRSVEHVLGATLDELRTAGLSTAAASRSATGGMAPVLWRATSLASTRADGGWLVEFRVRRADGRDEADMAERAARLEFLFQDLTDRYDTVSRSVGLISHDLQAPTRRLLAFVDLLRQRFEAAESDGVADRDAIVDAIERGAQHLLRITTGLSQYARLGTQPMPLEAVDAQQSLDTVLDQLALKLQELGASVEVPSRLPLVVAAPPYLAVVFQNLLENAVKFVPEGRRPSVVVEWRRAGDDVEIDVVDNGIGIPDARWGEVFQPLRRLEGGTDSVHTGLGLTTVRDLVRRFGGSIRVATSTEGVGTTFRITLRAAPGG